MSKFADIKVGDTVFIETEVLYSFSGRRRFFVPKKVNRVTAHQFVVDNKHYKKENGLPIGRFDFSYAYKEGDKVSWIPGELVRDQTKELNEFKKDCAKSREIHDILTGCIRVAPTNPRLHDLHALAKQFKETYDK